MSMFSFPNLISFDNSTSENTGNNNNNINNNVAGPKLSAGFVGGLPPRSSGPNSTNASRLTTPNQFMQQQPPTITTGAPQPPPSMLRDSFAATLMKQTAASAAASMSHNAVASSSSTVNNNNNNNMQPLQAHAPNMMMFHHQQQQQPSSYLQQQQLQSYPHAPAPFQSAANCNMIHNNNNNNYCGGAGGGTHSVLSTSQKTLGELESEERSLDMEEATLRRQLENIVSHNRTVDQQLLELQHSWHSLYELRFRIASEPPFDISADIAAAEHRLQMETQHMNAAKMHLQSAQQELAGLAPIERQLVECQAQLAELELGTAAMMEKRQEMVAKVGRVADVEGQREQTLQRVATILDTTASPNGNNNNNNSGVMNRSRPGSVATKRRSQSGRTQNNSNNNNNNNNDDAGAGDDDDHSNGAAQRKRHVLYGRNEEDEDDERSEIFDTSSFFVDQDSSGKKKQQVNGGGRFDTSMNEASAILSVATGNSNSSAPMGTKVRRAESNMLGTAAASRN